MRREKRFCNHGIDVKDDFGLEVYVPHRLYTNRNARYVVWNKMTSCLVIIIFGSNTRLSDESWENVVMCVAN